MPARLDRIVPRPLSSVECRRPPTTPPLGSGTVGAMLLVLAVYAAIIFAIVAGFSLAPPA